MSENETEKSIIIYQPVEGQAGIDVRVESDRRDRRVGAVLFRRLVRG